MQLIPGTSHIVRWTKQNLLDTTTYFPQAKIRDTRTDTVLETLNLDFITADRYSKKWDVVQDPSNQGREIEIEITVYEDSAHTVSSGIYGRWTETYLVLDSVRQNNNTGGFGGGEGINYQTIEDIIVNVLEKKLPGMLPDPIDLSEIAGELGGVKQTLAEKIKEIIGFGKKADNLEGIEKNIVTSTESMASAVKTLQKAITDALSDTTTKLEVATKAGADRLEKAASDHELLLSGKTEKELEYAVGKFKAILEEAGTKLSDDVIKNIASELERPMKIQSLQEHQVVRTPKEKEEEKPEDKRVSNLITHAS